MKLYKALLFELYAFIFLVPLIPFRTKLSVIPISVDTVIGGIFIVTYMLYIIINKKVKNVCKLMAKSLLKTRLGISILVYVLVCIISLYCARNRTVGIAELARFMEYPFFFYFILWEIHDIHIMKNIFKIFSCSVVIALAAGVLQAVMLSYTGGQQIVQKLFYSESQFYGFRVYSTYVNPNYWGAFVNFVFFIYFFMALDMKNRNRKVFFSIAGLCFINLILTFTLASWLSFLMAVLIVSAYKKPKLIKVIIALMVFTVLIIILIPPLRFKAIEIATLKVWTGSERIKLWTTGFLMFKEHPVLGVGIGNYLVRYGEYIKRFPYLYLGRKLYTVHNSYIKVLAETGIPGFIAYMMIIYNLIHNMIVTRMHSKERIVKYCALGVLCGSVTFIAQNFTNNLFFIPQANIFFWLSAALVIVYGDTYNFNTMMDRI